MREHASLGARLLTAAGALIAVALIVATVLIGFVLHRFVQGQIDQRLDTQIVFLTSLLRTDATGRLSVAGSADGPPFERPHRGWYWQVVGPANALTSSSLDGADLDGPAQAARDGMHPPPRKARDDRPQPADGIGPDGDHLHYRIKTVRIGTNDVRIVTSAPRAAVLGPLREAMTTLALSLLVLGLALVLAILLQIRLGLRPLETLRHALADVRAGRSERVPPRQPREIRPLVDELNGLLEQNAAGLERARRHVANLAHGLKTPLATLAIATASGDQRDVATLHPLVIQMERRIRHHLGRARAAALDGPVRAQTRVASRLQDLVDVLAKIHGERRVAVTMDVTDTLVVACEAQDFDEMAGNLLDNAFKFTRSMVHLHAVQTEAMIVLTVDDNGPGLTPQQRTHVLRPGQRLDEAAPGFGFGLSITRELAELYGGNLTLGEAPDGGLSAVLQLPAPPPASAR